MGGDGSFDCRLVANDGDLRPLSKTIGHRYLERTVPRDVKQELLSSLTKTLALSGKTLTIQVHLHPLSRSQLVPPLVCLLLSPSFTQN